MILPMVYHQMQDYLQITLHYFLLFIMQILQQKNLNNDLVKINRWAYQCKMSFNPDPSKQAQGVIFSRKTTKKKIPSSCRF